MAGYDTDGHLVIDMTQRRGHGVVVNGVTVKPTTVYVRPAQECMGDMHVFADRSSDLCECGWARVDRRRKKARMCP
jgi:hypothetical protein